MSCLRRAIAASGIRAGRLAAPFSIAARESPDDRGAHRDQVYLDTPIAHFLFRPHTAEQLAAEFTSNYAATFGQRLPDGGFAALVSSVATLMTGDDHELWNNAPNVAVHLPDTWTPWGRDAWSTLARRLYDAYQTPRRVHALEIPPLSARIVDTRFARSADRTQMSIRRRWPSDQLAGRPDRTRPAGAGSADPRSNPGFTGHFTDWALADYAQYAELALALTNVSHDVVLVTGDVHFGRVAEVQLRMGGGSSRSSPRPWHLSTTAPGGIGDPLRQPSRPGRFPVSSRHRCRFSPFGRSKPLATLALWAEGSPSDSVTPAG